MKIKFLVLTIVLAATLQASWSQSGNHINIPVGYALNFNHNSSEGSDGSVIYRGTGSAGVMQFHFAGESVNFKSLTSGGYWKLQNLDGLNKVLLHTDGNSYLKGGKFGIGTSTFDSQGGNEILRVKGAIVFDKTTATSELYLPSIEHNSHNGSTNDLYIGTKSNNGDLRFFTGNTGSAKTFGSNANELRMIISDNGEIGIGTSSPSYDFHLVGDSYLQGDTKINGALLFNKGVTAPITGSTHPAIYESTNSGLPYPFNEAGNLIIQPESTYNKDIVFMAGNPTPEISTVIKHNGRMGIGTTNPTESNLHIYRNTTTLGWGDIDQTQAVLKVEDKNASLYVDGNSIYTNSKMNLGTIGGNRFTIGTNNQERIRVTSAGKVGIGLGDQNPTHRLEVNGAIRATEIKVQSFPWPDYVFEENYKLKSLEETAAYIKDNQHLPEIPSAAEVEANGIALGEMNALLLKKIEELTLHLIEMKEALDNAETVNVKQEEKIQMLLKSYK
ncbi:hypothetical protein [Reichenbachiella sp.]|uniref:hypothetical protein n=1 Tax=Reichenbachiella sp. TaxID=2184521 RepID=UPI003BB0DE46